MRSPEAEVNYTAAAGACALSTHGELNVYLDALRPTATADAEFFAHLVAWNARSAKVRDSLAALPAISIAFSADARHRENAYAHLAELSPGEVMNDTERKALRYAAALVENEGNCQLARDLRDLARSDAPKMGTFITGIDVFSVDGQRLVSAESEQGAVDASGEVDYIEISLVHRIRNGDGVHVSSPLSKGAVLTFSGLRLESMGTDLNWETPR